MYASMSWLKGENDFKPNVTVWTILSAMLFDWGFYGSVFMAYTLYSFTTTMNDSLQNSGVRDNGLRFSISCKYCSQYLSYSNSFPISQLVNSGQPRKESTKLKK